MTAYKNKLMYFNGFMLALIIVISGFLIIQNYHQDKQHKPVHFMHKPISQSVGLNMAKELTYQTKVNVNVSKHNSLKNNDLKAFKKKWKQSEASKGKRKQINISKQSAMSAGKKIQGQTNIPRLIGHFDLSIEEFLHHVESKGAKLVVYDKKRSVLIGQIKRNQWNSNVDTKGMSVRTRQVTRDLPVKLKDQYNIMVHNHYGVGIVDYLIMLPLELDAHFWGLISEILKKKGVHLNEPDLIDFTYFKLEKEIHLLINRVDIQGKSIPINTSARFL